jgi:predicted ATP-grasp superfamily ATP-dependent carboligase
MVNVPIKVEPLEFECEETTQHIETEAEMYEKQEQRHSTINIVSIVL